MNSGEKRREIVIIVILKKKREKERRLKLQFVAKGGVDPTERALCILLCVVPFFIRRQREREKKKE